MRRATLLGLLLIALVLMSSSSAMACGIPLGRCFVPYNCCGPCYAPCCYAPCCCAPCYCYCVPVVCRPVCCEPACCQPAASVPKAAPAKAAEQPQPTLAPVEPPKTEKPAPSLLPTLETKAPEPAKPVEKKAAPKAPAKIILPSELTLPTPSDDPPKAAEGDSAPAKTPVRPKSHPVDRHLITPAEKPLVAEASFDNPFILETDQLQIWTDSTGNFRVEARFISFDEKTVRLQRPSGQYIRVAFNRLSNADKSRVRDLSLALAMKTSMK